MIAKKTFTEQSYSPAVTARINGAKEEHGSSNNPLIPTQQQFLDDFLEFLRDLKHPGPEGHYVKLHPWAVKSIIHRLEDRVSHIIDNAHRYDHLMNQVRTAQSRADLKREEKNNEQ